MYSVAIHPSTFIGRGSVLILCTFYARAYPWLVTSHGIHRVTVSLGVAKGHAESTDWLTMRGTSQNLLLKFPLLAIGAITKLVHVSEVILPNGTN